VRDPDGHELEAADQSRVSCERMQRFIGYELRSTALDAARDFYAQVCGDSFWQSGVTLAPLPEPARLRGAPAHWLGEIGVADWQASCGRFVELGAERLGPVQRSSRGAERALFREPFGAIVSLVRASSGTAAAKALVAWHLMHSPDLERSSLCYRTLCGWSLQEYVDLGADAGRHRLFAWDASGPTVGSMTQITRVAQVHPQWLFFFAVDHLDRALARVRELGGLALAPLTTASGARAAGCDDPQGGAFGLWQAGA
jgi:predicted enzyme related to lactoylglutathione lyase